MNTKTKIVLSVALVLVVAWLGMTFPRGNSVVNQIVGGAAGPESSNDYQCNAGSCQYFRQSSIVASSTLCVMFSPSEASTTISSIGVSGSRGAGGGAFYFDIGLGKTYATTSTYNLLDKMEPWAVSSQISIGLLGTSSPAVVLPPKTFILVKAATTSMSTSFDGVGSCNAVLNKIGK